MRVIITGGAGFIGSHLGDALLARGYHVIAVDNLSKGTRENIAHNAGNPRFSFVELDILEHDALVAAAGEKLDVVVHLAAAKIPRYESAMNVVMANFNGA